MLIALSVVVVVQVGRPPASTAAPTSASVSSTVTTKVGGTTRTMTVTQSPTAATATATAPGTTVAGAAAPANGASSTPGPSSAGSAGLGPAGPISGVQGPVPPAAFSGLSAAALPPGQAFVAKGDNAWHVISGTTAPMGSGPMKYTFTVEVENGIENAQADQDFADLVDNTLADPRSWIGSGRYTLQRIDTGTPSFRISLTSQLTVRQNTLCGWEIHYEASCYARDVKRVAINNARWARGAESFNGDRGSYRVYAINHEVGHALGYVHQPCATNGGLAPVMMQQSWSTADDDLAPLNPQLIPMDGKVCKFNPYPYPMGSPSGNTTSAPQVPGTRADG